MLEQWSDGAYQRSKSKTLSYVRAKEEVGNVLHEYGVTNLEDILELRIGDLIEAGMTLTQVHQLTQLAAEVSDAKHMQDPPNETANNELSGEHSEIGDDSGRAFIFADEEIRKALDYVGADEEA